jgi:hypothetical protein
MSLLDPPCDAAAPAPIEVTSIMELKPVTHDRRLGRIACLRHDATSKLVPLRLSTMFSTLAVESLLPITRRQDRS